MIDPSPSSLARAQLLRDKKQLAKFPKLLPHKIERMRASSFAFLRGAAPLFYSLLKDHRSLVPPLPGSGWIAGDLHLENFGAFRTDGFGVDHDKSRIVYGANDFDDAVVGPWVLDALRLTTSLLLGARAWVDATSSLTFAEKLLEAHAAGVDGAALPQTPRVVARLLEQVSARKRVELLDHCSEREGDRRRLRRGPHYHELTEPIAAAARKAFGAYVAALPADERSDPAHWEIRDLAFRVSGTGSLGMLRVGILVAGKGGPDGGWLFDMKEQGLPSPSILLGKPKLAPAERVLAAERACLEHPPRLAGTTKLGTRSMFVRRLAPQEDRVDLAAASPSELRGAGRVLGGVGRGGPPARRHQIGEALDPRAADAADRVGHRARRHPRGDLPVVLAGDWPERLTEDSAVPDGRSARRGLSPR